MADSETERAKVNAIGLDPATLRFAGGTRTFAW
jgi:hypothetical protein